jgi:hypothetical protein
MAAHFSRGRWRAGGQRLGVQSTNDAVQFGVGQKFGLGFVFGRHVRYPFALKPAPCRFLTRDWTDNVHWCCDADHGGAGGRAKGILLARLCPI